MSLNWKEINAVLEESRLPGAFLQGVIQPTFDSIVFELYQKGRPFKLFASVASGGCRLHLTERPVAKTGKPLRFQEFIKSRLRGAQILDAGQIGQERVVKLELEKDGERFFLYFKLWSNAANVIVTDSGGIILDAMQRRPKRKEIGGEPYDPEAALNAAPKRATEKTFEIRDFPAPEAEGSSAFKDSLSARIEAFYDAEGGGLSRAELLPRIESVYTEKIGKLENAVRSMEEKLERFASADRLKEYGDMLMAEPPGDAGPEWIECQDFYHPGQTVRIPLVKTLNVTQNAQRYYEEAKKDKSGLASVERELALARSELAETEAELDRLRQVEDPLALERALVAVKRPQAQPQSLKAASAGVRIADGEWTLILGRTGKENDELLRRQVRGSDWWLHARDVAGAYVFIKARAGKSVPLEVLLDAANLAIYHSKGRASGKGNVYYTQVKYLRRAKDGPVGLVIPTQEKNLSIQLDPERLRRLKDPDSGEA
jgi:predicted ribosome quality control (RQC) complex YloA/Tae2 family protein